MAVSDTAGRAVRPGLARLTCCVDSTLTSYRGWIATRRATGNGDPTSGPSFLLPAFSAVFLGSTQFRDGRVNVWGTVVAVYVLAVGVEGLQLAGAPVWIPDLFNGIALALAASLVQGRPVPVTTRWPTDDQLESGHGASRPLPARAAADGLSLSRSQQILPRSVFTGGRGPDQLPR